MPQQVRVGTILILQWPELFLMESDPYAANWRVVQVLDGCAVDRNIRAAGWNFFFMASVVKWTFIGRPAMKRIQAAVQRILDIVNRQHFNAVEITGIVTKRFLGIPYTVVSAHPRHLQQHCYLDGPEARRLLAPDQKQILPARILSQTSGEKAESLPSIAN